MTHATNQSAMVPTEMDTPDSPPAPATATRIANQTAMTVRRFIDLDMSATLFRC